MGFMDLPGKIMTLEIGFDELARRIDEITYAELRELSYMGASVIHDEAIFPIRDKGIPINIRNTHDPEDPGTMIVAEREATHPVCGIASRAGFSMINIEKTLMNREIGFGRRVLGVLLLEGLNGLFPAVFFGCGHYREEDDRYCDKKVHRFGGVHGIESPVDH